MADTWRITSIDRQAVEGPADQYVLTNYGPDTAYYGGPNVTSSSNDGSVTAGSSVTVAPTKWLISAGQSRVNVRAVVSSDSGGDVADEATRAATVEDALSARIAQTAAHVVYGSGAVPPRPAGFALVVWRGTADPAANALEGDEWVGP